MRLVESFLASDRIVILPESFNRDPLKRRVLLTLHMNRIVQHLWEAIRFQNAESLEPQFDRSKPIRSTSDMPTWYTGKPCHPTRKSHVNQCVFDSTWKPARLSRLIRISESRNWVNNVSSGFEIIYIYNGVVRNFCDNYLIRLTNSKTLVLEVKGEICPRTKPNAASYRSGLLPLIKNANSALGRPTCPLIHPTCQTFYIGIASSAQRCMICSRSSVSVPPSTP